MGRSHVSLFLAAVGLFLPLHARASDSGTCPAATAESAPSGVPPSGKVRVTILSMDLNSDMEGDDDYVPFYDNRADVFGTVTINGTAHHLKEIEDDDDPEWHDENVFVQTISGTTTIDVQLKEEDNGITGANDEVDASPNAGNILHLTFNPCSLTITGDYIGQSQGVIEVNTGTHNTAGKLRLRVEMDDGRALTTNDVSLVDFDLIQVIPGQKELVGGKNMVGFVRVGSSVNATVPATLRVMIKDSSEAILRDETITISPPLKPNEVRKIWLFKNAPLQLPERTGPYGIKAGALVTPQIPPSAISLPNCQTINNGSGWFDYTVVRTRGPQLLWARVGTLMDLADYATSAELNTIKTLGSAFIDTVFPFALHVDSVSPIPLTTPATGLAADWIVTVLSQIGIPVDCALPFLFTFELNAIPILTGHDRLMGVLKPNWFDRFTCEGWHKSTGLSLVEAAPHAVIFEARTDGAPSITLPGHELGHTYGLSTDPEMKNSWACDLGSSLPGFEQAAKLACGAVGGFDEYKHPRYSYDAGGKGGVPTWGYWVSPPGGLPSELQPLANQEQCDSVCLMGSSPENEHLDWPNRKRWIDYSDYARLLAKLKSPTVGGVYPNSLVSTVEQATGLTFYISNPPKYVYLSGIINGDHSFVPGPWYVRTGLKPDVPDPDAAYGVRFKNASGVVISDYGIPLNWNNPDGDVEMPMTFFGVVAYYPSGTAKIELYKREKNGTSGPVLYTKVPSSAPPVVTVNSATVDAQKNLSVKWTASDANGEPLRHTVMITPDGVTWWPAVHDVSGAEWVVPLAGVAPGTYNVAVFSSDGLWLGYGAKTFTVPATFTPIKLPLKP
jgi:hypothetical protein